MLVHDQCHWAFLCGHNTSTGHNWDVGQFVVVNSTDIDMALGIVGFDESNVVTSNGAICTTVNEGASLVDASLAD